MTEPRDDLLVLARTDPRAFAAFYRSFERALLGFVMRHTGRADLAADLTAETYGSAAGATPGTEPDLILVTGRRPNGDHVTGYVKRVQLNATSCNPRTPRQAMRCDRLAGRSRRIPVYARNGATVLGTFTVDGA